jgi:hypothetical protein
MTVKGWLSELLLKAVRAYLVGRTVHWMTRLDGQPLHRGEGKVISGRIDRFPAPAPGKRGNPNGMTLFWSMTGRPVHEIKRFSILSLVRDKTMGWVFYD